MLKEEEKAYMVKPLEWFGKATVEAQHKTGVMKNSTHIFTEVEPEHLIDLINNPRVRRHIPLSSFEFSNKAKSKASVNYKEQMWINEGYGSTVLFI